MKKIGFTESMLSNDHIFRSLIESEVEETETSAGDAEDMFDSVFDDDSESGYDRAVKDVDSDLVNTAEDQMADPKEVKMVVKQDEVTGQTESYITVEEFANFCKYSGLSVREAAAVLCEENSEESGEDLDANNFNVIVSAGFDKTSESCGNQFVKHMISNGINVRVPKLVTEGSWSASADIAQVEKWYNDFLSSVVTDKNMRKDALKAKIGTLKACVTKMQTNLDNLNSHKMSRATRNDLIEFTIKEFVPFKNIYNLIKYKGSAVFGFLTRIAIGLVSQGLLAGDIAKVTSDKSNLFNPEFYAKFQKKSNLIGAASLFANIATTPVIYKKLLESQIKKTNEAIEFLEKRLEDADE